MPGILQDIGKFLPTAGAIALPAIADVVSGGLALPADAALAGVGGALGKAGENATQGQNPLQANDLTAGAEGAVGAGVGMGVGSLAGKALGALANPAADAASSAMMRQAGGALDRDTADYLTGNNVYNFDDAAKIAPQLTGKTGGTDAVMSNAVANAAQGSTTPIDLNQELTNYEAPLQGYPGLQAGAKDDINGTVNDILQQAIDESGGQPGKSFDASQFTPSSSFKASQMLRTAANTAENGARDATGTVINPGKAAATDVYNGLAKQIEDKVFGTDEAGNTAVPIGDADKQALKESISSLQQSNPKLYETLSQQIDGANSWADIRSAQQPFVKVSQAARAAEAMANKTPGRSVMETNSVNPLVMAANAVKGSKGANIGETNVLGRLSKIMGSKNANRATALLGGIPGVVAATSPNMVQGSNSMQPTAGMAPGQANPYQTQMMPQQGPSPLALQAAGGFIGMMDPYAASQYAPSFNAAMPQLQQAQQAQAALQGVESAFNTAGGGAGRIPGLMELLGGQLTGGAPMAYQQSTAQLAPILSKLGIQTPLPSLTNTGPAAQTQFQNIQQLLQAIL